MRIPVEDVIGPENGYYIVKVGPKLVQTTPMEYVMVKVQMALVLGALAVFPIFGFYVLKRLGRIPRFSFIPWLLVGAFLFFGGAALTYFLLLPTAISVLTGFATDAGVSTFFSINKFILFTVISVILFALVFELPLVVSWLTINGFVSVETLKEKRKHVWVGVFILTALITADPTPISQVLLSLPVIILYEFSILSSRIIGKK
jgi:sec-independent protein translocase protein TatC